MLARVTTSVNERSLISRASSPSSVSQILSYRRTPQSLCLVLLQSAFWLAMVRAMSFHGLPFNPSSKTFFGMISLTLVVPYTQSAVINSYESHWIARRWFDGLDSNPSLAWHRKAKPREMTLSPTNAPLPIQPSALSAATSHSLLLHNPSFATSRSLSFVLFEPCKTCLRLLQASTPLSLIFNCPLTATTFLLLSSSSNYDFSLLG